VSRFAGAVSAIFLVIVSAAPAQTPPRRLTTVEAIRQFPGFFHLQNVLLRGELVENGERMTFRADDKLIGVITNKVRTLGGPVEVRGQLIDVGRLEPEDPRLTGYDGSKDPEHWPRPGEELVISLVSVTEAQPATSGSVRALALEPWRFSGQTATVIGQFRGRNLFGDLPGAPAKSTYDFVLRAADGAVWVTGLRPRGKGFDLSVDARVDTNQWVQVTGVVRQARGLVYIEGGTIAAAKAPAAEPDIEEPAAAALPVLPVEVVFSQPTEGDVDVSPESSVRIQFSKGLNPATLEGQFRGGYLAGSSAQSNQAAASMEIRLAYDAGTRAVEIKFSRPLERFRTFRLELLDGIKGFDGAPFKPWTLTFSTGG
jgi:hypothetical protein